MKKVLNIAATVLIAGTGLLLTTPFAMARDHTNVNWSISIGTPYPPAVVYSPPPVVYVQPQPVYVQQQPVYVAPAPVVQYGRVYYHNAYRPPYYGEHGRNAHRHHREHGHGRH